MKTILVINNCSPEAEHAAKFALIIAQKIEANILLANTTKAINRLSVKILTDGSYQLAADDEVLENLKAENDNFTGFIPGVDELDISEMNEGQLSEIIHRSGICMMVKGVQEGAPVLSLNGNLNIHTVLNKVRCPLMLVPMNWQLKGIERIVYIADLRYCRTYVISQLVSLAKPLQATLSVAHISASGLPDMEESYAKSVFAGEILGINYDKLFFNNIKEKNVSKTVDVLINGMHNDMMVMVNHRYHFEEIVGRYITDTLPANITVPLLVFPY